VSIRDYFAQLEAGLRALAPIIATSSIERDIDANLEMGFIKGRLLFLDGSALEFSEQLPTDRRKYRFHYMDGQGNLVLRWDSAPHHRELSTHPFHQHTLQGVQEHPAITMLEALDEIEAMIQL
jgi:hypothetical protein